jgi:hypothetical protein
VGGTADLEEAEAGEGAGKVERDEAHCVLLAYHPQTVLVVVFLLFFLSSSIAICVCLCSRTLQLAGRQLVVGTTLARLVSVVVLALALHRGVACHTRTHRGGEPTLESARLSSRDVCTYHIYVGTP